MKDSNKSLLNKILLIVEAVLFLIVIVLFPLSLFNPITFKIPLTFFISIMFIPMSIENFIKFKRSRAIADLLLGLFEASLVIIGLLSLRS